MAAKWGDLDRKVDIAGSKITGSTTLETPKELPGISPADMVARFEQNNRWEQLLANSKNEKGSTLPYTPKDPTKDIGLG